MATKLVHLAFEGDLEPLTELVRVTTRGVDPDRLPPPPARLAVVGKARILGGGISATIAPSPELLRWLANAVEMNPNFA